MPIQVQVTQTGLEASIQQAAQKAGRNLKINLGTSAKDINALSQPLGRITGQADEFTKSMEAANARVLAFGASVGILNGVVRAFKDLVSTTIEVEKSLASINAILQQNSQQINRFKNEIFEVAKNTEQTFATVAEAALELSRQGLKAEEVTKRLNDALILSRLSGLDAANSVAGLTSAINAFNSTGITSAEVLNKLSAAAASAAVSERDLIEAIKRSGSVAVTTGVEFDELVGIVSALQQKTSRGGSVIGNSLKTIFTRIQSLENLETLQDLGVQVTDLGGNVVSSSKLIENLAGTFQKLDQQSQINLADKLVGKFQIAPFLALIEDYNSEVVTSARVTEVSFNATNEAYQRNIALNQTLSAVINEAAVNFKQLANTLGEIGVTDSLKNIISFFSGLAQNIRNIVEGDGLGSDIAKGFIKGFSAVLSGPGLAIIAAIIGKLTIDLVKFGTGSLKTFFGINKAAKEQATIQGQIASTLLSNEKIQQQILAIENSTLSVEQKRAAQAKFFTTAINEQLMKMKQMQGIAATISPAVVRGTASARKASGGFLPIGAEKSDISRGVGGAPSSAKPVVIPNFAFGGGKRGTMVANDSEYIVPNYANGGDAIFNQNMAASMGLPANAKKITAASGYIPNFVNENEKLVLFVGNRGNDEKYKINIGKNQKNETQFFSDPKSKDAQQGSVKSITVPTYKLKHGKGDSTPSDIETIKNTLAKNAEVNALNFIHSITNRADLPEKITGDIKKLLNPGAFEGMAGSIFEVALGALLDDEAFLDYASRTQTSRIDLPYSEKLFAKFGATGKGSLGAEVKASDKTDLVKGAAIKFYDILVGGAAVAKYAKENEYSKRGQVSSQVLGITKREGKNIKDKFGQVNPASIRLYRQSASGYIPNFASGGNYVFDSDKIDRKMANQILKSILATKKRKDLLIAPAGAGKSTAAAKLGRFIMSPADVQAAKSFTILSGAARAKKSIMSAGLASIIEAVNSSGGKVSYLYAPNSEITKRRYGRVDGGPVDTRSMKQLRGTLRAPMNQFDFIKGVKSSSSNFSILRASNGYVPNFAGGALEDAIQREQAAGLPVNQIRINQSGKLRNAQNPMGLAVTNTRDEPTGKIPNFAASANEGKSTTDVFAKLFMLQTVLTGVTAAFSDAESTMGKFASNVTTASMALMSMAMIRGMGGGGGTGITALGYQSGRQGLGAIGKSDPLRARAAQALGKGVTSVMRFMGPLGTGLTKIVPFVGRLVPILGQALFAFQALNAITGGALGRGLKSLMTDISEALNIVDTPAEKAAKAFDKISESANKALASGAFGGGEKPFSEFLKRMSEKEKKALQEQFDTEEEDPEKLRAMAAARSVEYLSFSRNKEALARAAGMTEEELRKQYTAGKGLQSKTIMFGQLDEYGGAERKETIKGASELQKKAIDAFTTEVLLNFSSSETQAQFKKLRDAGLSEKDLRASGIYKQLMGSALESFGEEEYKKVVDKILASGDLKNPKKLLEINKMISEVSKEVIEQGEKQKAIDQIRVKNAKALLESTIELKKMRITDTSALENQISTAETLGSLSKKELRDLKDKLQLRQLENKLFSSTIDSIKKQVLEMEGVSKNLEDVENLNKTISGLTEKQLSDEDELRKVLLGVVKVTEDSALTQDDVVNFIMKQLKLTKDLSDVEIDRLEKALRIKGANEDTVEAMRQQAMLVERMNKAESLTNKIASAQRTGELDKEKRDIELQLRGPITERQRTQLEARLAEIETRRLTDPVFKRQQAFENEQQARDAAKSVVDRMDLTDLERRQMKESIDNQYIYLLPQEVIKAYNNQLKLLEKQQKNEEEKAMFAEKIAILTRDEHGVRSLLVERLKAQLEDQAIQQGANLEFQRQQNKLAGFFGEAAKNARQLKAIDERPEGMSPEMALRRSDMLRGLGQRFIERGETDPLKMYDDFMTKLEQSSDKFRDNMIDGIMQAVEGAGSLSDILRNTALEFAREITRFNLTNVFNMGRNTLFSGKPFATGGRITGGSGTKDDVPAMLMGGEYVIKKDSVQKYGLSFMDSLNNGNIPKFAKGGYFAPGFYGQGAIKGKKNLLDFATQSYTTGSKDVLFSDGNAAAISLEPESVRLSNIGRTMGTPMQRATEEAKGQAFDLYLQQMQREKELREAEKQRKKALRNQLIMAAVSTVASGIGSNIGAGIAGSMDSLSQTTANPTFTQKIGAAFSGGWQGLKNFGTNAYQGVTSLFSGNFKSGFSSLGRAYSPYDFAPKAITVGVDGYSSKTNNDYFRAINDDLLPDPSKFRKATGGSIPSTSGIDTVPAMLSGGEFVMNNAAAKNIGTGNLNALNSGASSMLTEEKSEELNQKIIEKLDELIESGVNGNGEINITVNNEGKTTEESGGGNEQGQNFAKKIRDAVIRVIEEEKRLGGTLRRGLA